MNDYAIIGFYDGSSKKYIESIYQNSISTDVHDEDAIRFPSRELAEGVAKFLRGRGDGMGRKWFVQAVEVNVSEEEL